MKFLGSSRHRHRFESRSPRLPIDISLHCNRMKWVLTNFKLLSFTIKEISDRNSSKTTGKETPPPSVLTIGWGLYDCFLGSGQLLLLEATVSGKQISACHLKKERDKRKKICFTGGMKATPKIPVFQTHNTLYRRKRLQKQNKLSGNAACGQQGLCAEPHRP